MLGDHDFREEFTARSGECGNRYRPAEMHKLIEAAGFQVKLFESNMFAEDLYLDNLIPRLRMAGNSSYKDLDETDLRIISGRFHLTRKGSPSERKVCE